MRAILVGLLLCSTVGVAHGQSPNPVETVLSKLVGAMAVSFTPTFAGGNLVGCALEFNNLLRDRAYKSGGFVRLTGSFGFIMANREGKNVIGPCLKVIVHDIDTKTMNTTPSPPSTGYISVGRRNNAKEVVAQSGSDTPGALFIAFQADHTSVMIVDALLFKKIIIAYARNKGGVDVRTEIDLTVENIDNTGKVVRSDDAVDEMISCSSTLFKSAS